MRRLLLGALLSAAAGCPLAAQRLGPPADRPKLRDVVDTNDAHAYYELGISLIERDPRQAAAAFYWAARINPAWGDPLYARRAALLMSDRGLLKKSFEMNHRRQEETPEFRRLDSLQFRALMLNPFLYRGLDQRMFMAYIRDMMTQNSRMYGGGDPPRPEMDYQIEQYLRNAGAEMRAWLAYSSGNFDMALRQYEMAGGSARNRSAVRLERGRIFGMLGRADSAVVELRAAVAEMRTRDDKDLVVFYDSKALAEYSVAVLLEGAGDAAGAQEAYGQALQEDLSYYPAHMRLGLLALGKADTTTALSELALASQLAADEPFIRYTNGFVLAVARHYDEALAELRKVVELEPYYALPYLRLGQTYETMGKGPEAASYYQSFLDHADQKNLLREYASSRLAEVKQTLADMAKP